LARLTIISG